MAPKKSEVETDLPRPSQGSTLAKATKLIAVIGDEDTVTGFLLGGIGDTANVGMQRIDNMAKEQPIEKKIEHDSTKTQSNFFIVTKDTEITAIEKCFQSFVARKDIGIILICQYIADKIRECVDSCKSTVPTILEIPSKEHPYDPEKDSMLKRAKGLFSMDDFK
ncbi:hypothetical protein ACOME3_004858 [Neoechinorhynchus agilis]